MKRRHLVAVALVTVVAAGCGGSSGTKASSTTKTSSAPAATAPGTSSPASTTAPASSAPAPGMKTVVDADDSVSIDVPSHWQSITGKAQMQAIANQGLAADPALAKLFPQLQQLIASGAKLFAIDPTGTVFHDNVNIIVQPAAGATPADIAQAQRTIQQKLQSLGATGVSITQVTVDNGPALRSTYSLRLPGVAPTLQDGQLYAIRNGNGYVITVSVGDNKTALTSQILQSAKFH